MKADYLFQSLSTAAAIKADDMTPRALSNTAISYARAGISAPELFRVIEKQVEIKADEFNSEELAFISFGHLAKLASMILRCSK